MKTRQTSVGTAVVVTAHSASVMPTRRRRHPVSIAVSMALLAAAAASGMAAEPTAAAAENAGAQDPAQQDVPATPSPGSTQEQLSTVTVIGVRQSQERAIQAKREAASIQDSISAEGIGQLPDTTITDALQRITGVQIDRNGGEGTEVDVRGLPQVGSMLNGEVFITPDQITSQQPNFETLPATLFNQVDVIKSPTASQTEEGISGSLDLHTYRPWDLPHGFTFSYNADGERGDTAKKTGPEASGLVSFNDDGRWGLLLSGDFSNTTRAGPESNNAGNGVGAPGTGSSEGLDQYGVILNGENAESAGSYAGFVGAWNGLPIPSKIVQYPNGSVSVNGDGRTNEIFMGSQDISLYESSIERKREAGNASFQADLGDGFTLHQRLLLHAAEECDRNVGLQFNSTDWQGATYVPVQSQKHRQHHVLSQYNTPPPTSTGPGRRSTPPRRTKNGRVTSNRTRRSFAGTPPRRTSMASWTSTMAATSKAACAAFTRRPTSRISRPTSTFPIPTAACGLSQHRCQCALRHLRLSRPTGREPRIQRQRHSPEHDSHHREFHRPQSHGHHARIARRAISPTPTAGRSRQSKSTDDDNRRHLDHRAALRWTIRLHHGFRLKFGVRNGIRSGE